MVFITAKTMARILCVSLILCTLSHAGCSVDTVIVKGRAEQAPRNARVRVQLIFPKEQPGDSGEATIENGAFSIPIEFLTQSRRPVLLGSLGEKCDRRPKTVVVTLVEGDQEVDRISLDFAKDFVAADPTAYTLRSELVLRSH